MNYYGTFHDLYKNNEEIAEVYFYDGVIADFYEAYTYSGVGYLEKFEVNFYHKHWMADRGTVLELACGSGRITIDLATRGANIVAVDNSPRMLALLENKLKVDDDISGKVKVINQDVFQLDIRDKVDIAILPATTISLLADDVDKLIDVFKKIYDYLPLGGKFIFDYKSYLNIEEEGKLHQFTMEINNVETSILMQEFNNKIHKYSTLNIFLERTMNNKREKFLSQTKRKIMDPYIIYHIIEKTKFTLYEETDIEIAENEYIRFVVLLK